MPRRTNTIDRNASSLTPDKLAGYLTWLPPSSPRAAGAAATHRPGRHRDQAGRDQGNDWPDQPEQRPLDTVLCQQVSVVVGEIVGDERNDGRPGQGDHAHPHHPGGRSRPRPWDLRHEVHECLCLYDLRQAAILQQTVKSLTGSARCIACRHRPSRKLLSGCLPKTSFAALTLLYLRLEVTAVTEKG